MVQQLLSLLSLRAQFSFLLPCIARALYNKKKLVKCGESLLDLSSLGVDELFELYIKGLCINFFFFCEVRVLEDALNIYWSGIDISRKHAGQ